jgi:AraC-like DNA-binding protein
MDPRPSERKSALPELPAPEQKSATLHTVAIAVRLLEQRGFSASQVLRHSGVTEAMLKQPSELITQAQELTVFSTALRYCGDSALGLEIGAAFHLPSYGLLGYAMLVSPTLAWALRRAIEFPTLLGSYFQIRLRVRGDTAWIVVSGYHYRDDLEVFNTDMCVASLWALVCDTLGSIRVPSAVRFKHSPPVHANAYARVLGCEPEFNASEIALGFPGEWLDQTLQFAEPVSCHMALQQCEQLEREWSRAAGDGLLARLLRLLHADPRRYGSLEAMASALCLSGRTLRRRLQSAGTTFQVVLDQARHERALEYLKKTHLPIAEISDLLGFSEPASFRQAFKRWTGKSPSQERKR